jgi:hypothetical protein
MGIVTGYFITVTEAQKICIGYNITVTAATGAAATRSSCKGA